MYDTHLESWDRNLTHRASFYLETGGSPWDQSLSSLIFSTKTKSQWGEISLYGLWQRWSDDRRETLEDLISFKISSKLEVEGKEPMGFPSTISAGEPGYRDLFVKTPVWKLYHVPSFIISLMLLFCFFLFFCSN